MNHDVKDLINPVYNSLCLAVLYLPEIRSSACRYLVQSRYRQVFYSFRNTSSRDQPLGHFVHIMMMSYRVGPEIPLRLHGVTNPSLDSCQPNRHFRRYPCTFIATQLCCDVWYTQSIPTVSGSCTISWSKEMILDIRKALAYELHDLVLCLGLGLDHHIILLMM